MGSRGSLRGDRAWGKGRVAGGLEQGSWGLGRVSKGLGGWGLERAKGLGSGRGLDPQGTSGRTFARSLVRSLGRTENSPLCPIGRFSHKNMITIFASHETIFFGFLIKNKPRLQKKSNFYLEIAPKISYGIQVASTHC